MLIKLFQLFLCSLIKVKNALNFPSLQSRNPLQLLTANLHSFNRLIKLVRRPSAHYPAVDLLGLQDQEAPLAKFPQYLRCHMDIIRYRKNSLSRFWSMRVSMKMDTQSFWAKLATCYQCRQWYFLWWRKVYTSDRSSVVATPCMASRRTKSSSAGAVIIILFGWSQHFIEDEGMAAGRFKFVACHLGFLSLALSVFLLQCHSLHTQHLALLPTCVRSKNSTTVSSIKI